MYPLSKTLGSPMTYKKYDIPRMEGTNAIQAYVLSGRLLVHSTPFIHTVTGVQSVTLSSNSIAGLNISAQASGTLVDWNISLDESYEHDKSECVSMSLTVTSAGSSEWGSKSITYTIQVFKLIYAYDINPSGVITQDVTRVHTVMPSPLYPTYTITDDVVHTQNSNSVYLTAYQDAASNGLQGIPSYPGSYIAKADGTFLDEPTIKPIGVAVTDTRVYTDQEKLVCMINPEYATCTDNDLRIVYIAGSQGCEPFTENPGNGFNIKMHQVSAHPSTPTWEASYITSDEAVHNYRVIRKRAGSLVIDPDGHMSYDPSVWSMQYNGYEIDSTDGVIADEMYPPSSGWTCVTLNRNPEVYREDSIGSTHTYEYVGSGDCLELRQDSSSSSSSSDLAYRDVKLKYYVSNDYISKRLDGVSGTYGGNNKTGRMVLTYDPVSRLWCPGVSLFAIQYPQQTPPTGSSVTIYDNVYPIAGVGTIYAPINGSWMDIGVEYGGVSKSTSTSKHWGFAVSNNGTGVHDYAIALGKGDHYEGSGVYTKKPLNSLMLPYSNTAAPVHELEYTVGQYADYGEIYYYAIEASQQLRNIVGHELGQPKPPSFDDYFIINYPDRDPLPGTYKYVQNMTLLKDIRVNTKVANGTIQLNGDNHYNDIVDNFFGIGTDADNNGSDSVTIDAGLFYHQSLQAKVGYERRKVVCRVDYKGMLYDQYYDSDEEYEYIYLPRCPLGADMSIPPTFNYMLLDRPVDKSNVVIEGGTGKLADIPYVCPGSQEDSADEIYYELLEYIYLYHWTSATWKSNNEVVLEGLDEHMTPLQLGDFIWDDGQLHYNSYTARYITRPDVLTAYEKYSGRAIYLVYGTKRKAVYNKSTSTIRLLDYVDRGDPIYSAIFYASGVTLHKCEDSEDFVLDPDTGHPRRFLQYNTISEEELSPVRIKDMSRTYDIELEHRNKISGMNYDQDPTICPYWESDERVVKIKGTAVVDIYRGPATSGLSVDFTYPDISCPSDSSHPQPSGCMCLDATEYNLRVVSEPSIGISWRSGAQEMCKAYSDYINIDPDVSASVTGCDINDLGPCAIVTGIKALEDDVYIQDFTPISRSVLTIPSYDGYGNVSYHSIPSSYHPLSITAEGSNSYGSANSYDIFSAHKYSTGFLSTHFPDISNISNTYTYRENIYSYYDDYTYTTGGYVHSNMSYVLNATLVSDSDSSTSEPTWIIDDTDIQIGSPLLDTITMIDLEAARTYTVDTTNGVVMGSVYPFEGRHDGTYRSIMAGVKIQRPTMEVLNVSNTSGDAISNSSTDTSLEAVVKYRHKLTKFSCDYPYCGFEDEGEVSCSTIKFTYKYYPNSGILKYVDDTLWDTDWISKNPVNIPIDDAITGSTIKIPKTDLICNNKLDTMPTDIGDAECFINCYVVHMAHIRTSSPPSIRTLIVVYCIPDREMDRVPVYRYSISTTSAEFSRIVVTKSYMTVDDIMRNMVLRPLSRIRLGPGFPVPRLLPDGSSSISGSESRIEAIFLCSHNMLDIYSHGDIVRTTEPLNRVIEVLLGQMIINKSECYEVNKHEPYDCPRTGAEPEPQDYFITEDDWTNTGFRIYYKK